MNEDQIKDYQQRVCDILMDNYFPPSKELTITPERVRKNNNLIKHGIIIRTNDSHVAPTFYVDDFIETHEPEAVAEENIPCLSGRTAGSSGTKRKPYAFDF